MSIKCLYICTSLSVFILLWSSCSFTSQEAEEGQEITIKPPEQTGVEIIPHANKIATRIPAPAGFERISVEEGTFAEFLRNLPLKPHGSKVLYFDGGVKEPGTVYMAVVNIDVGEKNLQQCADAIMRLRGEYLFKKGDYNKIHFNFTSGDTAKFTSYAMGFRPRIEGSSVSWHGGGKEGYSYANFRNYMTMVFAWAGTYSLSNEMQKVSDPGKIKIGDVFIQGGFPGHAVIVVDLAFSENTAQTVFLLAQSYMPAQEIQILCNNNNEDISPWYLLKNSGRLNTPEWSFMFSDLKRFSENY